MFDLSQFDDASAFAEDVLCVVRTTLADGTAERACAAPECAYAPHRALPQQVACSCTNHWPTSPTRLATFVRVTVPEGAMLRREGIVDGESTRVFIIVPLGLALGGVFFFFLGVSRFRRERAFVRGALSAPGVVIGIRKRWARTGTYENSGPLFFPLVRYTTQVGQTIEFESPTGSSPSLVREGQAVTVLYHLDAPQQAHLSSGCLQYGLPILFILLGLWLALFASLFGLFAWFLIAKLPTT